MEKWQISLKEVISDPKELLNILDLNDFFAEKMNSASESFSLRVPKEFISRMQRANPKDPLLLQVLPLGAELEIWPGYTCDPLQESCTSPARGLLHKYHGRVLLTLTGACAINCRYCFRRHFPYESNVPNLAGWEEAITYIANDPSITEVILSGGDPLILKDDILLGLIARLEKVSHINKLRIHTRLPIVIPARVTESLLVGLKNSRLQIVCIVHVNHANEIDAEVAQALQKMRAANITLFNQSVLLREVNDSALALRDLSERLFVCGVIPYYLHLVDKVQGAAHFAVNENEAAEIMRELMKLLPGYLVPRLVREVPGVPNKVLIPI